MIKGKKMKRIATTISDFGGSGHHRIFFPGNWINKHYELEYFVSFSRGILPPPYITTTPPYTIDDDPYNIFKNNTTYQSEGFDSITLQRLAKPNHLQILETFRKNSPNAFISWACCDSIFTIDKYNKIAYDYYANETTHNTVLDFCNRVDRVVVSTKNQIEDYTSRGIPEEKIVVVPNVLHKEFYPVNKYKSKNRDSIKICWFGSTSYLLDFYELVIPAMQAIQASIPNVEFHIYEKFLDISEIRSATSNLNIITFEWIHPQLVGKFLYDSNFDFGVHLMRDIPFNRARTSSKNKEMLFSGGMLPITYKEHRSMDGYLNKIENPSNSDIVDYVKRYTSNPDAYHKELKCQRNKWYGKLWMEDHIEEYEKLFGIDVLKSQQMELQY